MKTSTIHLAIEQAPTREKFSTILAELELDNNYNVIADFGNKEEFVVHFITSEDVKESDGFAKLDILVQKLTSSIE